MIWLSFCNPNLPKNSQFLGVCIVPADNTIDGMALAHLLKINPGGEIMSQLIPQNIEIPEEFINKLLSRSDIVKLENIMKKFDKQEEIQ